MGFIREIGTGQNNVSFRIHGHAVGRGANIRELQQKLRRSGRFTSRIAMRGASGNEADETEGQNFPSSNLSVGQKGCDTSLHDISLSRKKTGVDGRIPLPVPIEGSGEAVHHLLHNVRH